MSDNTEISWAHHTLNFWMGCDKVAPECAHCYIARGLFWGGRQPYGAVYRTAQAGWGNAVRWQRELEQCRLLNGDRAYRVFTCSISDFFSARADEWRADAWKIIRDTPSLVWLVLTKRPERIASHLPPDWGMGYPNVWLGTSTGCRQTLNKMDTLRAIPAALRFVSAEPLLEDISGDINLEGFGWIATGGESGPGPEYVWNATGDWREEFHTTGRRVMNIEWAARLRDRVKTAGLPFLFKQITAEYPGTGINALGREWHEFPAPPQGLVWAPRKEIPRRHPYMLTRGQIRQLWEAHHADKSLCDTEI